MKSQANRNYKSDDEVMTPDYLAEAVVKHFNPTGRILEPCRGTGTWLKYLPKGTEWCEIREGKDFFHCTKHYDYIITNPPWSRVRDFLNHGMKIADNIIFLITVNHVWTKARIQDLDNNGFGIREICLIETPNNFPPLGFQLGAIHFQRGYVGDIKLGDIRKETKARGPKSKISVPQQYEEEVLLFPLVDV